MAEVSMLTRVNSYLRTKVPSPVISYKNLRTLIGILGMLLPAVCYFGGRLFAGLPLQPSISFYYHTNVRDAFVGLLVAVGMFMVTYRGYENIDNIVSHIIGLAALGIAIFPCLFSASSTSPVGFFQINPKLSNIIHLSSAGIFFFLLAMNSIFLFTLTDKTKEMSDNKKTRNKIYVACGVIILLCILALIVIGLTMDQATIDKLSLTFWLEMVMLNAFGISWLVKGEAIFGD
ncbi:MAG: DUF998 domain-containing protein [Nitrospinae bacterium]|nr:DUF998 domain-containing protein [Nitrospinota bacterium]